MKTIIFCLLAGGMLLLLVNQNRELERLRHSTPPKVVVVEKEIIRPAPPPPAVNTVTVVTLERPGLIQSALRTTGTIAAVTLTIPLILIEGISKANL